MSNSSQDNAASLNKNAPQLTTSAGAPVPNNQDSMTAGEKGPLLVQDYQLLDEFGTSDYEQSGHS